MINKIVFYCDGSCWNESELRIMGIGIVPYLNHCGAKNRLSEFEISRIAGTYGTNNEAEYEAIIAALELALEIKDGKHGKKFKKAKFHFYTDSMIVVKQIEGTFSCNSENLKPYLQWSNERIDLLGFQFGSINWVRRTSNQEADKLSKQCVEEYILQLQ